MGLYCSYFLVDSSFVVVLDNNLIEVLDNSFVEELDSNFVVGVVTDNSFELVLRIYFGRMVFVFVVLHKLELELFDNYYNCNFEQVLELV